MFQQIFSDTTVQQCDTQAKRMFDFCKGNTASITEPAWRDMHMGNSASARGMQCASWPPPLHVHVSLHSMRLYMHMHIPSLLVGFHTAYHSVQYPQCGRSKSSLAVATLLDVIATRVSTVRYISHMHIHASICMQRSLWANASELDTWTCACDPLDEHMLHMLLMLMLCSCSASVSMSMSMSMLISRCRVSC